MFRAHLSLLVLLPTIFIAVSGLCPGYVLMAVETGLSSDYAVFMRPSPAGSGSLTKLKMPSDCHHGLLANSQLVCCLNASGASILCKSLRDALKGIESASPLPPVNLDFFQGTANYYLDQNNGVSYAANTSTNLLLKQIDFSRPTSWTSPSGASTPIKTRLLVPAFNRTSNSTACVSFGTGSQFDVWRHYYTVPGDLATAPLDKVTIYSATDFAAIAAGTLYGFFDDGNAYNLSHTATDWSKSPRVMLPNGKRPQRAFGTSELCKHLLVNMRSDPYSLRWMNTSRMFLDDNEVMRPENLVELGTAEKPVSSAIFLDTIDTYEACSTPEPLPLGFFYCDAASDTWYAPGNVSTNETIVLFGPTIILGNLTLGGNVITFNGNRSSLLIESCFSAEGNRTLTVEFSPSPGQLVPGLVKHFITANCSNVDLSSSNLVLKVPANAKRCETINFSKTTSSTSTSLSGILSVTRSNCNTWWIILVSVVAGLIVLALITLVLLATFHKGFKKRVRPFWIRSQAKRSANVQ